MEKILLLLVLISTCWAAPKDLTGKNFYFTKQTNTDHVKLLTPKTQFNAFTICLRFFTDQKRTYSLFSLATPTKSNGIVIFKPESGVLQIHVNDVSADFLSLSFSPNQWHSLCVTWQSDTGLAQLWLNGKASVKRFVSAGPVSGKPVTVLGQEQDAYGANFDAAQSFLGMITKVHMWDHVISVPEIEHYPTGNVMTPGNVFNWKSLDYEITGSVSVDM